MYYIATEIYSVTGVLSISTLYFAGAGACLAQGMGERGVSKSRDGDVAKRV